MAKKASAGGKFMMNISSKAVRIVFNVLFYSLAIIAIIFLSKYAYQFCYQLFGPVSVTSEEEAVEINFYIEMGDSTKEISKKLERCGLIVNDTTFYIKTKMLDCKIQPGEYTLNTGMDYEQILRVISDYGKVVVDEVPQ